MDKASLLAYLEISTEVKTIKTCYIGPPIIATNTSDNATQPAEDANDDTTPAVERHE